MRNLLLIAIFFSIYNMLGAHKLKCVVQQLYKELKLSADTKQRIVDALNERNLNNKFSVDNNELFSELIPLDFATTHEIEEMLRDFKNQAPEFQRAVKSCGLSMDGAMKKCTTAFTHCEHVGDFTVAKSCPDKHQRFNYAYCIHECSDELDVDNKDMFVCLKPKKSARSNQLTSANEAEVVNYKGLGTVVKCPKGFTELQFDLCVANCPSGQEDLGAKCLKQYFEERKHDMFSYTFQNDKVKIKEDDI